MRFYSFAKVFCATAKQHNEYSKGGEHKIGADSYVVIIQPRSGKECECQVMRPMQKEGKEKGGTCGTFGVWVFG